MYLDLDGFKDHATIPPEWIDELEASWPGFTERQLELFSAFIDARLSKRYDAPFASPYPLAVKGWLARLVTPRVLWRRGVNALDQQYLDIRDDARAVELEMKEAADSVDGLYDLPLRADTSASGISKGGPMGYSEASPYVWKDVQASSARDEDRNGSGSNV
jgi:hypothetical protein